MDESMRVYTVKEVADILRLNPQTIYNNLRNGKIKASKFGSGYRFTEEQLRNLMENGFKSK